MKDRRGNPHNRHARPEPDPIVEAVLVEGLGVYLGRPTRIVAMKRKPLETSSHPIDRLRLTLDSGERLRVIFKRPQPGEKLYGNEKEVLIYQRLLRGRRFGAPELYASVYDEARGRYWLFLEDLGSSTLEHGDNDAWEAAVRWLAETHAAYMGREAELRALGCLTEHGPEYYRAICRAARQHLELAGAHEALHRFDALMEGYETVVAHLVAPPRTLIHGDIFAGNIGLQAGPRIRPFDWESAAVGLAAWDLTRLLDGWGPDRPAFVATYLDEFARLAESPLDPDAFRRTLAYCRILNVLWHLRWSVDDCRDTSFVAGRLKDLAKLCHILDQEGADA